MKRVLITGATSGIGFQLACDYAADGWTVYACGRQCDVLKNIENIHALSFDVSDLSSVNKALGAFSESFDLIILNAGNCEYIEQGKVDTDLFHRVFDVNFFGVLHCLEALQSQLTSDSHIAFMGSSATFLPFSRAQAYGASKAALAYLARSLAVDLSEKGIQVSLISPGFVDTPLTAKNDFPMPDMISAVKASCLIRRGLAKKQAEICFPRRFIWFLKLMGLLPYTLQISLMRRLRR